MSDADKTQPAQAGESFVGPVVIERTHPNQAYVTYGFGSEDECTQFTKATRSGSKSAVVLDDERAVLCDAPVATVTRIQWKGDVHWGIVRHSADIKAGDKLYARAASPQAVPAQTAKQRYDELTVEAEETDPVERLRAFCSLAMTGQDWLDVEPFFDALTSQPAQTRSPTDEARDAVRYRWLRSEHFPTADKPPLAQVVWKASDNRHSFDWANMIDGNDLDRAIDAALLASQASGGDHE